MPRPINLTVRPNPKGSKNSRWVVDGLRSAGKQRQRRYFPTQAKALAFKKEMSELFFREGIEGADLTKPERMMAISCIQKLAHHGKTLEDATRFYLSHLTILDRTRSLSIAAAEYAAAKKQDGCGPAHLADIRRILKKLGKTLGDHPACQFDSPALSEWLRRTFKNVATRNNSRAVLFGFFKFCVSMKYCEANPVAAIDAAKIPKGDRTRPVVFSPEQIAALLKSAAPSIVPGIAIAAFAGLRDAEIKRLDWSHIDLPGRTIEVEAKHSKTGSRRLVPISDNLAAWLAASPKAIGPVIPDGFRRKLDKARLNAELVDEATGKLLKFRNHLRHGFASHRMNIVKSAPQVALEMGNSPDIVFEHYRNVVKPDVSVKYWAIMPSKAPRAV